MLALIYGSHIFIGHGLSEQFTAKAIFGASKRAMLKNKISMTCSDLVPGTSPNQPQAQQ